jgi:hypothetical protein
MFGVKVKINYCICFSFVKYLKTVGYRTFKIFSMEIQWHIHSFLSIVSGCLIGWLVDWFHFWLFESGSCYVAQTGHKLLILMPRPPKHWECRHEPSSPALCSFMTNLLLPKDFMLSVFSTLIIDQIINSLMIMIFHYLFISLLNSLFL